MYDLIKQKVDKLQAVESINKRFPGTCPGEVDNVKQELQVLRDQKRTGLSRDEQLRQQSATIGRLSTSMGKAK